MPLNDITPYYKYMDDFDISEEQKIELIHTVWNIMEACADRAFGKDSMQLAGVNDHNGLQPKQDKLNSLRKFRE